MAFEEGPNETPAQKRRRLHLMATFGGSLAPRGTYGLPSKAQVERSRAERKRWSRRARFAWAAYWMTLAALFAAGIAALASETMWLFVAAVAGGLVVLLAGTAIGVRSELREASSRHGDRPPQ